MSNQQTVDSAPTVALDRSAKGAVLAGLAQLILIGAVAVLAIYMLMPPAAVPAGAPPTEFSSGRAMKHLEIISRVAHPVGSQGHAEVREYLLKELAALGASPEAVTASALDGGTAGLLRAGTVHNVVARIPGTSSSKAIMLTGHYDTVPNSPGASDDGAGVAAILETVRAIKAGGGLSNDLIVLLTDGEEVGLLGARAFVAEHPWAKDVGLVLNFEARGNAGPVLMFETSQGNGRLIEEFAESAPHPVSNSLLYEIYRILPNDTDFTVFKGANLPGLNFAYIDGVGHYHTSLDNIANLDERSLQHHGSYALALTRHAGGLNLTDMRGSNSVYFDVLGAVIVRYPKFWVVPLTALACLLFVATLIIGLRRRALTPGGLALGALATIIAIIVAYGCAALVLLAVGSTQAGNSEIGRSGLLLVGLMLLAIAAAAASYALFGRKTGPLSLLVGGLFWWVVPTLVATVMLPTASYLFTWPLLLALCGALFMLVGKRRHTRTPETAATGVSEANTSRPESPATASGLVFSICALVAVILFAPVIYIVFIGMSLSAAAALMAVVALLLALFLPTLGLSMSSKRWLVPVAAACAGLVLILVGFFAARSIRHPKADSLFYALNADGGKAVWGSSDPRPDEWTAQFLSTDTDRDRMADFFPFGSREFITKPAAPAALEAPRAEVLSDQTSGEVRHLKLRITSPRSAPIISVYFDETSGATRPSVNGRQPVAKADAPGAGAKRLTLRYYALPPEGIELDLDVKAHKPLEVRLVDQSYGLPASLTAQTRPRPDSLIPVSLPYNDSTMVSKGYRF
ncbi:MAG: M20/M25/M40 family metallo-hydrolase [Acidobacteria bacterium]|nr:M20/M25/M40 family metallo-hydrolase [Acidobacteriota bacterium]